MKRIALSSLCALLLAGCAVGPDYERPSLTTPEGWRSGSALPDNEKPEELANLAWWKQLEDPVLDALVGEALANNRDLKIAAARVDEAAGVLGSTRAQLFPQLGASLNGSRAQASNAGVTPIPVTVDRVNSQYSAALNVGWEIDLFGRLRRATEASRAELLSSEESRRGLALSLAATVANSYISCAISTVNWRLPAKRSKRAKKACEFSTCATKAAWFQKWKWRRCVPKWKRRGSP